MLSSSDNCRYDNYGLKPVVIDLRSISIVLAFLLVFSFLSSCKPRANTQDEYNQKIEKLHAYYKSQIKETYEIPNSARNVEEAVMNFLNEIAEGKTEYQTLCDKKEIKEIFLPNNYNTGSVTSFQEPEEAWKTISIRRQYGIETLERKLKGKKLALSNIQIKEVRNLNSLKGHIPATISVKANSEEVIIEEIKLIIENKGQFKVCIVSR